MNPPPIALGLVVCEKAVVEEGSKNATLVNTYLRLRVDSFPSRPQQVAVYAACLQMAWGMLQ